MQGIININRFLLVRALKYANFLRREKVSLVHLNNSVTRNHPWILSARLTGIPCITHQRGINEHYTSMDHWMSRQLHYVICISNAVKENLIEHGFDAERLKVIYNGLDPGEIRIKNSPEEIRRNLQIEPGRPIIGILGNIKEWKGQEVVLRATAELQECFPKIACLLVGDTAQPDKYYETRLKQLIDIYGLKDKIFFTGYQPNVADWLNIMDIVIHSSIKPEPFGRVILEAMAMRKPVIGCDSGAVPEIVKNGETGLLYPPGDYKALTNAISSLLENHDRRKKMGDAGSKRLQEYFHIKENITQMQTLYKSILGFSE